MSATPQPGWYADPAGAAPLRWWDGSRWTDQVVRDGVTGSSPLGDPQRSSPVARHAGSLLDAPVLVVSQRARIVELTSEYAVRDRQGRPLGTVVEVGQTPATRGVRLVSGAAALLPRHLEVREVSGRPLLLLTRPGARARSQVVVERPGGGEVGRIVQERLLDRSRFVLEAGGRTAGRLRAEDLRAWRFALTDADGAPVAQIRKTFEGVARTLFTTADDYVVTLSRPLAEPLRSLVLAGALMILTVRPQTARG